MSSMYQYYVKSLIDYFKDRALNKKVKTCSICGLRFDNMEEMWSHKKKEHG
jgi:hypothetical protein